ncbi:LOW QUALITY PROTEIN: surfeit locus protein 2-like [Dioscorea cayenensis subsp. rotundata]|uniref:LOW QUALITY PROTEIN: surfeit locus protein 2-like n=1 Tax=Dioscorea cayennensis subsp. rotundata TaxID=55577 RepID=A0AB40BAI1_DIOCR|nr:LOW QUALITY PROTEIN: surfeit locus protein 2-like [Dioscorea cayenensis subsp. rotundata]
MAVEQNQKEKEGSFLLGAPKFTELDGGRLRCLETGHELPAREKESYSRSKACRLALIDSAVAKKKPPLNMFRPDPVSKSKLMCELTGDSINKTEEYIWKHINGRRFLNKLEQKEADKLASPKEVKKDMKQSKKLKKSSKITVKKKGKDSNGNGSLDSKPKADNSDSEEPDFWVPPVGSRWDFDDGKDRWESCENSNEETDDDIGQGPSGCQ